MKKIIIIGIISLLVCSGIGATALPETTQSTLKQFDSISFSEPQLQEQDNEISIHLSEATSSIMIPGEYLLPTVTQVYTFPFTTDIQDVIVRFSNIKDKDLNYKISLTPEPIPDTLHVIETTSLVKEQEKTYPLGNYPETQYTYHVGAGRRGDALVNYLSVRMYPVQYDATNNKLFYAERADIQITYKLPEDPIVFADEYDMVIIAPDKFARSLQPLVEHKNSHDVATKLVTLNDIYTSVYFPVEGRDCAEEIKYFHSNF